MVLETESVPAVSPAALLSESAPSEVSEAAVVMDQEIPSAPPQSKICKNLFIQLQYNRWLKVYLIVATRKFTVEVAFIIVSRNKKHWISQMNKYNLTLTFAVYLQILTFTGLHAH